MTGWWVESIINVAVLLMRFFSMSFSIIRISSYTVAVLLMRFPRMSVEPTNRGIIAVLLMRFIRLLVGADCRSPYLHCRSPYEILLNSHRLQPLPPHRPVAVLLMRFGTRQIPKYSDTRCCRSSYEILVFLSDGFYVVASEMLPFFL